MLVIFLHEQLADIKPCLDMRSFISFPTEKTANILLLLRGYKPDTIFWDSPFKISFWPAERDEDHEHGRRVEECHGAGALHQDHGGGQHSTAEQQQRILYQRSTAEQQKDLIYRAAQLT